MGLSVTTDDNGVKVIRQDKTSKAGNPYTTYSLMVGVKNGEEWTNMFIECGFKKGVEVANKTKILIKSAFITGNIFNGKATPKIIVMDFDVLEGGDAPKPSADDFLMVTDDMQEEMPFT